MSLVDDPHLTFRFINRYDPAWPKWRLMRWTWSGVADGRRVCSRKLTVAVRTRRLFGFDREFDGWRVVILGIEMHYQTSYGGVFAP
jgi:hypothetical protein